MSGTTLTPGTGGSLSDASGNSWTLTPGSVIDENGNPVPDGSDTAALTIADSQIYGQDGASGDWFTYSPATKLWTQSAAPPSQVASPEPAFAAPSASSSPDPTPAQSPGTRDPSQTPFASTSVFNLPIGSGAEWTYNAQLAHANVVVNTAGNWNEPIYTGTASDPLVTVTNTGSAQDAAPQTFQVHIPVGAEASQPGDNLITIDDTTTNTWYSFGEFTMTSPTTATAGQGSGEPDDDSGIAFDNSNQDEGVGTLRESDLQAGTIDHMLRINLPFDMLLSVSSNPNQLAANAWPQTAEDGFGPSAYTGTVPYGITMGIPASAVEPADVAANAGANMLWKALQDHGAMIRDAGGSGNNVAFQTDQNVNPNDPLIQGMEQFGSEIMAQVEILANQGPNSVNGGGTPIVPLDPPPSDATGAVPTADAAPGGPAPVADTVSASNVSVASTAASPFFISGSGDTVSLSGGETITDSGGGNTYVLPALGNGRETFASNILSAGDTLNLTTVLAATDWNGSTSTLQNYLTVASSGTNATVSIAPTSGGSSVAIATISGAIGLSLSGLLANAIT